MVIERFRAGNSVRDLAWLGSLSGIAGAGMLASNASWSGWGFVPFLVSSLSLSLVAGIRDDRPLLVQQLTFTAVNAVGIWRWLV